LTLKNKKMKLTNNFTLAELTVTNSGLPNVPNSNEIAALKLLCENILQPLREKYGKPIKVNSGFRSAAVNKAVGGVASSQHVGGQAADITGGNKIENRILFDLIRNHFTFDQVICEHDYTWIHVSYKKFGNRKQTLYIK